MMGGIRARPWMVLLVFDLESVALVLTMDNDRRLCGTTVSAEGGVYVCLFGDLFWCFDFCVGLVCVFIPSRSVFFTLVCGRFFAF